MNRAVEVSKPAVILKFDLLNDSPGRVTDVPIEIAIVEKPSRNPGRGTGRSRCAAMRPSSRAIRSSIGVLLRIHVRLRL